MRGIVESALRLRRLVVAVAIGLVAWGVASVGSAPLDALPEFAPPTVEVQTEALGLSAAEVEQLITVPLEQDLLVGVAFLDEIESVSLPGLSSVVMTFEPGTDLLDARQVVQERLTQAVGVAGLPAVAKPPQMVQPLSSQSRVSMVRLSSQELSPIEMSVLSRWVIGPRLMGVPGVANVAIWGNRERQLQVLVDPQRLRQHGVTLSQVVSTAGNALEVSPLSFLEASKPGTGGFIDTLNQRLNIFHEQAITSAQELAQVPVDPPEGGPPAAGPPPTLGDVTDVVEDHQPLIGDAVCPGGGQCLLLVIEKFPGAGTVEVTRGVEAALDALRPGLAGMTIDSSVYRPATYVETSFGVLARALLLGAALLLLVVGAFFWSWRRTLVVASAVAVSAAAALAVLRLRGTAIDLMIATGLVLGLTAVVADAVGDLDAASRRLRHDHARGSERPAWRAVAESVVEMRRSAVYAALVVAAAAAPLLFLGGAGGAFVPPIVLTYLLAVAVSMLVALVLTPALGVMLLSSARHAAQGSPTADRLHRGYDRLAPRLLPRTGAAMTVCAVLAIAGLAVWPLLSVSLQPRLEERDVLVHVEAAPGTSLPRMTELTTRAVADLRALPGVADVGGQVGRAVMSDQAVDVSSGELWVRLEPEADYDATLAAIGAAVGSRPELRTDVLTYSQERVGDVLGRPPGDVVVRVYGEDAGVRTAKAEEIRALAADVDGVSRADVDRPAEQPTTEVEVDLARAREHGIKPGDVRRAAASLLGGITVGNLFDERKVFDVVVWGTPQVRQGQGGIEQLLIDTPGGGHVQLSQVADVRVAPNPSVIRHESVASYLDVVADVAGRDVDAVADDVADAVDDVAFPLEHHAELLGGYAEREEEQATLLGVTGAALVAVLLLLQAAFGSWRHAALVLVLLPLTLVGGLAAVLLAGGTVGLGAVGGLVAVLGLAARADVSLVRRYLQLRAEGQPFGPALVLRGTREAVVPVVTTTVAVAAAMAGVLLSGQAPGSEVLQPAAAVVVGGLVTTLLVTLFVLPVLYLRLGSGPGTATWAEDRYAPVPEPRRAPADARSAVLRRVRPGLAAAAVLPALGVTGCGGTVADAYVVEHEPAHLEEVAGSEHPRVVLEARAVERLGITTERVTRTAEGLAVPSAALFVDTEGSWWVYTAVGPTAFVRHEVGLVRDDAGMALLGAGPPAGTPVVTVGVAELAGVEADVGH